MVFFSCDENFKDLLILVTFDIQYSIVNCSRHAVHYIPKVIYLIPGRLYFLTTFTHFPHPPTTCPWKPPVSSLSLWVCLVFDSTYKWDHTVFVFLCLAYFIYCNALKVHSCYNRIFFFLWLNNIPFCTNAFSLVIHLLMDP